MIPYINILFPPFISFKVEASFFNKPYYPFLSAFILQLSSSPDSEGLEDSIIIDLLYSIVSSLFDQLGNHHLNQILDGRREINLNLI
jgi:hypothetical protein